MIREREETRAKTTDGNVNMEEADGRNLQPITSIEFSTPGCQEMELKVIGQ